MKKLLIATVTLVTVGLFASQGLAFWGNGGCRGPRGGGWAAGDSARTDRGAAYEKYMQETAGIRQELASKQAEYDALMSGANPDPKRAGELAGDITQLRDQLRAKAPSDGYAGRGNGPGPDTPYCYFDEGRGSGPRSW